MPTAAPPSGSEIDLINHAGAREFVAWAQPEQNPYLIQPVTPLAAPRRVSLEGEYLQGAPPLENWIITKIRIWITGGYEFTEGERC